MIVTIESTDISSSLSKEFSQEEVFSVFRDSIWSFDDPPLDVNYVLRDLFPDFFGEGMPAAYLVKIYENEVTELLIFEVKDGSIEYKSGLILEESGNIEKRKAEMFKDQKETPYLYVLLAKKLFTWQYHYADMNQFSPYEIMPFIQQQLYHYEIDEVGGYYIRKSKLFGQSFSLDVLEGSYEETIYEWIHLFLIEKKLYSLFLSETQVQQANDVSGGIYGPEYETDENYTEIEDIISILQNEIILFCALVGIKDSLNIDYFIKYFEDYGDDEALQLIKNRTSETQNKVYESKDVTELDLSDNELESLPSEICQLTSLKELDLSYNALSSLPSEIGQLTNLTSLNLDANSLSSLPAEISQLTSLTSLWLGSNELEELPEP